MLVLMMYYKTVQKQILIVFSITSKKWLGNIAAIMWRTFLYLVYTERVNVKTFENIYDKMVSLCSKLSLRYRGNRNINANHLFKDKLQLMGSGKVILANNFLSNLSNFLSCANPEVDSEDGAEGERGVHTTFFVITCCCCFFFFCNHFEELQTV